MFAWPACRIKKRRSCQFMISTVHSNHTAGLPKFTGVTTVSSRLITLLGISTSLWLVMVRTFTYTAILTVNTYSAPIQGDTSTCLFILHTGAGWRKSSLGLSHALQVSSNLLKTSAARPDSLDQTKGQSNPFIYRAVVSSMYSVLDDRHAFCTQMQPP